jgi:hypothetical protein
MDCLFVFCLFIYFCVPVFAFVSVICFIE